MTPTPQQQRAFVAALDQDMVKLKAIYVSMAQALSSEYIERRRAIQQRKIQATPRHVGVEKKLAKHYAPLLLRVREHKGVAEIYWCTIHHGRYRNGQASRGTIPRYLARGKRPDLSYSLPALLKHAKAWELDLVIEVESRAARLRRSFREIAKLSAVSDALKRLAEVRPKQIETPRVASTFTANPDEALPPGVMPTPPTLLPRDDDGM